MSRSGVRLSKVNMTWTSRRGTPVQAQKASATVRRRVSAGSATAKSGSSSTMGVSQASRPSSTSVAAIMLVIGLLTEPISISVSAVTGALVSRSRQPKPRARITCPSWTTATATPGTLVSASRSPTYSSKAARRSPANGSGATDAGVCAATGRKPAARRN
jgi:hypothetical protein